jgi:hypothetical protein
MDYDARSPLQHQDDRLQDSAAPLQDSAAGAMTTNNYRQTAPPVKMLVGPWYLDEFGNPTREIKGLD